MKLTGGLATDRRFFISFRTDHHPKHYKSQATTFTTQVVPLKTSFPNDNMELQSRRCKCRKATRKERRLQCISTDWTNWTTRSLA